MKTAIVTLRMFYQPSKERSKQHPRQEVHGGEMTPRFYKVYELYDVQIKIDVLALTQQKGFRADYKNS